MAAGGPWQARKQLVDHTVPHLCGDKPGGTTGEQDGPYNPGFQRREIKPQNLWLQKPMGVVEVGETPSLTRELVGETHRILEHTLAHSPGNQNLKGHNPLVGNEGSD